MLDTRALANEIIKEQNHGIAKGARLTTYANTSASATAWDTWQAVE